MLPCPFCGFSDLDINESQGLEITPYFLSFFKVHCKMCGATGPVFHDLNSKKAVEAWNNRKSKINL